MRPPVLNFRREAVSILGYGLFTPDFRHKTPDEPSTSCDYPKDKSAVSACTYAREDVNAWEKRSIRAFPPPL